MILTLQRDETIWREPHSLYEVSLAPTNMQSLQLQQQFKKKRKKGKKRKEEKKKKKKKPHPDFAMQQHIQTPHMR